MPNHAIACINNGNMEQFPSVLTKALPVAKKLRMKLFCTCRMPDLKGQESMAYCPRCREWYHRNCEQIPDSIFNDKKENFICSKCTQLANPI